LGCRPTAAADALPEFAYRDVRLKFTQADSKPIADASIYGFCRELNLIWPRRDHEMKGHNDVLWDESFLGKTGPDGLVKATLPPGKWGFFALGHATNVDRTIVAGWTAFAERRAGDVIPLLPAVTKHWTLCFTNGSAALDPRRIFLKPGGFPVSIPVNALTTNDSLSMAIPSGAFQMWATGDAAAGKPGFALSWGTLTMQTPDGKIPAAGGFATILCKGIKGKVSLSWARRQNFGLEADLNFTNDAKALLTPGLFTLSYRRHLTTNLMGDFVGRLYDFRDGSALPLNMEAPLSAALDQSVSRPSKSGEYKLAGQLYVVDGNGHLLRELSNSRHEPANPEVTVTLNGQRIPALPVLHEMETTDADEKGEDESAAEKSGRMLFMAPLGSVHSVVGAVWDFTGPLGVFSHLRLAANQRMNAASASFQMAVPQVLLPHARNVLAQVEMLAAAIDNASGRRRKVEPTVITVDPARAGAKAAHNGSALSIGSVLLFDDDPISAHTIVHELGHDYGFHHGGLHETVVEVVRCAGSDQISQQPAKWMFLDRMNGIPTPEVSPHYPNKGLYLYGYAQGGLKFLHFMSAYEPSVLKDLGKQGYTTDELTAALLNLALDRDMTDICRHYGLNVTPDRVAGAAQAARLLCDNLLR
jgi:hypothetical protein